MDRHLRSLIWTIFSATLLGLLVACTVVYVHDEEAPHSEEALEGAEEEPETETGSASDKGQ